MRLQTQISIRFKSSLTAAKVSGLAKAKSYTSVFRFLGIEYVNKGVPIVVFSE